jgi:hypothetical protein
VKVKAKASIEGFKNPMLKKKGEDEQGNKGKNTPSQVLYHLGELDATNDGE